MGIKGACNLKFISFYMGTKVGTGVLLYHKALYIAQAAIQGGDYAVIPAPRETWGAGSLVVTCIITQAFSEMG
jgi:hypothetical protein